MGLIHVLLSLFGWRGFWFRRQRTLTVCLVYAFICCPVLRIRKLRASLETYWISSLFYNIVSVLVEHKLLREIWRYECSKCGNTFIFKGMRKHVFVFVCIAPGVEPRVSSMLSMQYTRELRPSPRIYNEWTLFVAPLNIGKLSLMWFQTSFRIFLHPLFWLTLISEAMY